MNPDISLEESFYGAATVGDRGQVVIPSEARKKFNIQPGEKLLVMGHPGNAGIVLCKIDSVRDVLSAMLADLKRIESRVAEADKESA